MSGAVRLPRQAPEGGIAGRVSGRLLDLAGQVRRLDPPGRTDPERFWRDKTEIAARLAELAGEAERRLGSDNSSSRGQSNS